MDKTTRNTYSIVGALLMASFLILLLATCLASSGRSDPEIQRTANQVTAIASVLGLLVLVVYTTETYLLRKTAEAQVETQTMPVVLFDLASESPEVGQPMRLNQPRLRNIGKGPAFEISVRKIFGANETSLEFQDMPMSLIEAQRDICPSFLIAESGQYGGMSTQLSLLRDLFEQGKLPACFRVEVDFKSLSGTRYQTRHQVIYDSQSKQVRTTFLKISEV